MDRPSDGRHHGLGRFCKYWVQSNGRSCPFGLQCFFDHSPLLPECSQLPAPPQSNVEGNAVSNRLDIPVFRPPTLHETEGGMPLPKVRRFMPNEPMKRKFPNHSSRHNVDESSKEPIAVEMGDRETKPIPWRNQDKRPRREDYERLGLQNDGRPRAIDPHHFQEAQQEAKSLLNELKEDRVKCTNLFQELQAAMKKRESSLEAREQKLVAKVKWLIAESKKAAEMLASSSQPQQEPDRPRDPQYEKKMREAEQNLETARQHAEDARTYAEEAERSNAERAFQIAELRQRQDTLTLQEVRLDEKQRKLDEAAKRLVERERQIAAMEAKIRARQASLKQQHLERQKQRQAQSAADPIVEDKQPNPAPDFTGPSHEGPHPAALSHDLPGGIPVDAGLTRDGSPSPGELAGEAREAAGEEGKGNDMQLTLLTPKSEQLDSGDEGGVYVSLEDDLKVEVVPVEGGEGQADVGGHGLAIVVRDGEAGGVQKGSAGSNERAAKGGGAGSDKCRAVQPKLTVAEALLKDAPELFQTLQEKGLLDGMELYPEANNEGSEGDDVLEGGCGGCDVQFEDLRQVLKNIWESSNLITAGMKTHHTSDKRIYDVDVLIALLEQARHMDKKGAGPVTRYWCRQLQCFLFIFEWHNRIVVERPEYGFATYIFEVEEGESIAWQIQRLVTIMSVPHIGRLDIWTNKPLQAMKAISEAEVQLLESYGWQRGTGLGTFLNYSDRIVHDRGNDEGSSQMWFKKVGKMLLDGRNRGRRTKQSLALPSAFIAELPSSEQPDNALIKVKAEIDFT